MQRWCQFLDSVTTIAPFERNDNLFVNPTRPPMRRRDDTNPPFQTYPHAHFWTNKHKNGPPISLGYAALHISPSCHLISPLAKRQQPSFDPTCMPTTQPTSFSNLPTCPLLNQQTYTNFPRIRSPPPFTILSSHLTIGKETTTLLRSNLHAHYPTNKRNGLPISLGYAALSLRPAN